MFMKTCCRSYTASRKEQKFLQLTLLVIEKGPIRGTYRKNGAATFHTISTTDLPPGKTTIRKGHDTSLSF